MSHETLSKKRTEVSSRAVVAREMVAAKIEVLQLLEKKLLLRKQNKLKTYFREEGPLRRGLYRKHMEFFKAGATIDQRLFMAANRVGKTEGAGGYECTLHLTGRYPEWWEGRRFERPVKMWVAGSTGTTTRDIIQEKMYGPWNDPGTGLLPFDSLGRKTQRTGIRDAIDTLEVQSVFGKKSLIAFKSYEQGRLAFEGTEQDVIWLDEEPPEDVYAECLIRLMTTNGILIITFTPNDGWTKVVETFLREAPELTARIKAEENDK